MLQLSELYIYPIKSLAGIRVNEARVTATGLEHDRRWMLVDENNRFISQRESAEMTQLQPSIHNDYLKVTHKSKGDEITIPLHCPSLGGRGAVVVSVWDDTCTAQYVSPEADEWFSTMLGINCRLIYMPEDTRRMVDQRYAIEDSITSFADAYPFLIIGQASLDDLNGRLKEPLPIDRFRPNLVFTGGQPFGEDLMAHFTIGDINFYGVKLCARCVMTTINQDNAVKGKEPLKTLASYRFKNNKILFGQNMVHRGEGLIAVGDELLTLSVNTEERFIVNAPVKNPAI